MTRDRKRKQSTRARMNRTGESYQAAHRALHPTTEPRTTAPSADSPHHAEASWSVRTEGANLPKGWLIAGRPDSYEIEIEPAAYLGKPAAHLRSSSNEGAVILSQAIQADSYLGQRVRLSGVLRCHEASGAARLWMRVDDMNRRTIAFDNMQDRVFGGTRDWTPCAVVLDVDERAMRIVFGLILGGPGQVWLSDVRLEIVGLDVPTTAQPLTPIHERPVNLDFGE